MKILSIKINNILSIEGAELNFNSSGLTLVEGWNFDTDRGNGAGKTAIFNALSFCIYDKLPRKITMSALLRRGAKNGYVECSVDINGDTWIVKRSRPKGVTFTKNGNIQTISQQEWESKLRLTYNQFLMSMYTAQSTDLQSSRFLFTNDADKKSFLLQLLNLDVFEECKKQTNISISNLEKEIATINSNINSTQSKVQAYSESLIDEDSLLEMSNKLATGVSSAKTELIELSNIPRPDLSKYLSIEEDINKKAILIASLRIKRQQASDAFKRVKDQIREYDSGVKCGECGASLDTEEAQAKHIDHQVLLKNEASKIKNQIDQFDSMLLKEKDIKDLQHKLNIKKNKESQDYENARKRISELQLYVSSCELKTNDIGSKLKSNSQLKTKILDLQKIESSLKGDLELKNQKLSVLNVVRSIYMPTGAQAYVLDSIVDFFNECVSKYIELLWPIASYTLLSYKESGKGDVSAKFSEKLTMGGQEISVGSLSGGEMKALSLCVDFAILDVLESQFGINLNPIILDEPYDGLDSIGRELVTDLLSTLSSNRQIIVIDHASEIKTMFSSTIRVEKRNGVSSVKEEV